MPLRPPLTSGNGPRFAHHLAAWLALVHLPPKPAINYKVSREELVNQAVWFILRGLGMTRKAIATHFNLKKRSRYFLSPKSTLVNVHFMVKMKINFKLGAALAAVVLSGHSLQQTRAKPTCRSRPRPPCQSQSISLWLRTSLSGTNIRDASMPWNPSRFALAPASTAILNP